MMTDAPTADSVTPETAPAAPPVPETAPSAATPPPDAPPPAVTTASGEPPAGSGKKHWYVVKVQSGREESIKDAIERRVKIEGLEEFFGQVVVPIERETVTIQTGKRKGQKTVKKKKKFPGYLMAEVEYNDKILYLFRETSGVGDFVGGSLTRAPVPMSDREVHAMLRDQEDVKPETIDEYARKPRVAVPTKLPFSAGDKVRVRDGTFQGLEGTVETIKEPKDSADSYHITVKLTVFGRPTNVQFEHWQIEPA
jgi:transcription termination/antitermination protein NusG